MPYRLPTIEEKYGYVQDQFNRIALRYDLTNDVISLCLHRFWKRKAVAAIKLQPGGAYLDVCCGTGDISLLIANMLKGKGSVTGLDFCSKMLDIAKSRAALVAEKYNNLSFKWVLADAQNMPFPDNSFDGAIISFGLRNLVHLQKGLEEIARVVRPYGKVINLDLAHPKLPIFRSFFFAYFGKVVPTIGELLQKDRQAYTYLPESLKTYPKPEEISKLFELAGLSDIRHILLALGTVALHTGTKRGVL